MLNHALEYWSSIVNLATHESMTTEQRNFLWSAAFCYPCISDEFANSSFKLIAIKTYELIYNTTIDKSIIGWLTTAENTGGVPAGWTVILGYYNILKDYFETAIAPQS